MAIRQLLPQLPAELRNEIYSYLWTPGTATTHSIPLSPKTYKSGHTNVQLCAIHQGSTSLLALGKYGFVESDEYKSWLMSKGLELWISVHFTGHLHTFLQKDWDAKTAASMRKLGKKYAWLKNVARCSIRIDWEPKLESLGRCSRGISGRIAQGMVDTLTGWHGERVEESKREVRAELCVDRAVQLDAWHRHVHLGLETFLRGSTTVACGYSTSSVTGPCTDVPRSGLTVLPIGVADNKSVHWADNDAKLIMRSVKEGGVTWREVTKGGPRTRLWMALLGQCDGVETARVVEDEVRLTEQATSAEAMKMQTKKTERGLKRKSSD